MKFIDFKEDLNEYLTDENRKISQSHLESVCKIYCKDKTCKYIFLSPIGHICIKKTSVKKELDRLSNSDQMISKSDNCDGFGEYEKNN